MLPSGLFWLCYSLWVATPLVGSLGTLTAESHMHKRYKCVVLGCDRMVGRNKASGLNGLNGYCELHMRQHRNCVIAGCPNKVAAHNKSGCCGDHRAEGRKLRP